MNAITYVLMAARPSTFEVPPAQAGRGETPSLRLSPPRRTVISGQNQAVTATAPWYPMRREGGTQS